ncbi:uncharacterized protein LOC128127072 [Lactuca sativa]|uniref:uncharacterized protein LOC128127072 n=1 Tax=Lactuca sativa TaxID=4236 RepID=UPI0022AF6B57|nr:uncharacterized protein LOC128127072 [Lactuca sativa]
MASGDSIKEMTSKFEKLNKFEGQDFHRWQKKLKFLLTTLKVVYVLSTPMSVLPESVEDEPLEATRRRSKWENDDYICYGHILNCMSDSLFDIYQNFKSAKELCDFLESKYMAEDASSKKFLISNFMGYKMIDSRPVMEQFHEILRILGQFAQQNLKMDEAIYVAVIIDKLPPSWKDFKHNLKHNKEELTLTQLGIHLRIEESIRTQERDNNPKGKNQDDNVTWWVDSEATSHVFKDIYWFNDFQPIEDEKWICKNLVSEIVLNNCGYKQVLESDKYILSRHESRDAIFDEERFIFIPRPRDAIHQSYSKNTTQAEDVSGGANSIPEPRKSTIARKAKSFGSDF